MWREAIHAVNAALWHPEDQTQKWLPTIYMYKNKTLHNDYNKISSVQKYVGAQSSMYCTFYASKHTKIVKSYGRQKFIVWGCCLKYDKYVNADKTVHVQKSIQIHAPDVACD